MEIKKIKKNLSNLSFKLKISPKNLGKLSFTRTMSAKSHNLMFDKLIVVVFRLYLT
jgi:hypothetical protein